mmetsp:Transcript_32963/g.84476  ORF Transcript_32963/g.84476 Transcript_32963/m.84476 type:complete len:241 (+) Transcript_32963:428-1150(+)
MRRLRRHRHRHRHRRHRRLLPPSRPSRGGGPLGGDLQGRRLQQLPLSLIDQGLQPRDLLLVRLGPGLGRPHLRLELIHTALQRVPPCELLLERAPQGLGVFLRHPEGCLELRGLRVGRGDNALIHTALFPALPQLQPHHLQLRLQPLDSLLLSHRHVAQPGSQLLHLPVASVPILKVSCNGYRAPATHLADSPDQIPEHLISIPLHRHDLVALLLCPLFHALFRFHRLQQIPHTRVLALE